jgi:hypothetical protein
MKIATCSIITIVSKLNVEKVLNPPINQPSKTASSTQTTIHSDVQPKVNPIINAATNLITMFHKEKSQNDLTLAKNHNEHKLQKTRQDPPQLNPAYVHLNANNRLLA